MILDAWDQARSPEESQLYQSEFDKWYGRISGIAWKEGEVGQFISKKCPQRVPSFNTLLSDFTPPRGQPPRRPQPPPLPPIGKPTPSIYRYGPGQPVRPPAERQPVASWTREQAMVTPGTIPLPIPTDVTAYVPPRERGVPSPPTYAGIPAFGVEPTRPGQLPPPPPPPPPEIQPPIVYPPSPPPEAEAVPTADWRTEGCPPGRQRLHPGGACVIPGLVSAGLTAAPAAPAVEMPTGGAMYGSRVRVVNLR